MKYLSMSIVIWISFVWWFSVINEQEADHVLFIVFFLLSIESAAWLLHLLSSKEQFLTLILSLQCTEFIFHSYTFCGSFKKSFSFLRSRKYFPTLSSRSLCISILGKVSPLTFLGLFTFWTNTVTRVVGQNMEPVFWGLCKRLRNQVAEPRVVFLTL